MLQGYIKAGRALTERRKEKTLLTGRSSEKQHYRTKIEQLEEGSPCPIYTEREGDLLHSNRGSRGGGKGTTQSAKGVLTNCTGKRDLGFAFLPCGFGVVQSPIKKNYLS